jgi:ketosteroid isomerase-like protein
MMSPPRLLSAVLLFALTGVSSAWQTAPHHSRKTSRSTALYSTSPYNGDDAVAQLPLLEAQLATLLTDDGRRELEEKISNAKMSAEFGVRKAQADFYAAFSDADVEAMEKVWSSKSNVRCVHPGMESLHGKEIVMKSWTQIFSNENSFAINPLRTHIDICGETAICSCVEETPGGGKLEALNVYHRESGTWRMTLHMASPIVMRQQGPSFL